MATRLTSINGPQTQQIAFHPNSSFGICVRAEHDGVMVIWTGGYQKFPYANLPSSPRDHLNRVLPLRLSRPVLASLTGANVVDVDFLKR